MMTPGKETDMIREVITSVTEWAQGTVPGGPWERGGPKEPSLVLLETGGT